MKTVIQSPRPHGRHAQSTDMFLLLSAAHEDFFSGKWPEAGLKPIVIQGVKVWVKPIIRLPNCRKSSKHRVMCECPECKMILSVGRLHQHVCKISTITRPAKPFDWEKPVVYTHINGGACDEQGHEVDTGDSAHD